MSKDVVLNKELWKIAQEEFNQPIEQPVLPFASQLGKDIDEANEVWNKVHRDYELLKVGNENLLNDTFEFQNEWGKSQTFPLNGLVWVIREYNWGTSQVLEGEIYSEKEYSISFLNMRNKEFTSRARILINEFDEYSNHINSINLYSSNSYIEDVPHFTSSKIIFKNDTRKIRIYLVSEPEKKALISSVKLEIGETPTPWTPSYKDIDAHPMAIELAKSYQKRQQEINELRNAIISGGGKL